MKNKIALATLAILPVAASNSYAATIGTVTATSLNVRSGPSTSYTIVTTVKKNEKVNVNINPEQVLSEGTTLIVIANTAKLGRLK